MRSENNKGCSAHLRAHETQYRTGNGVWTRVFGQASLAMMLLGPTSCRV